MEERTASGETEPMRAARTLNTWWFYMTNALKKINILPGSKCVEGILLILLTALTGMALETNFQRMKEIAATRFGQTGYQAVVRWQEFISKNAPLSLAEKLHNVNQFVNVAVRYGVDGEIWGERDYWATPLESIAGGAGDCEDFALAKYLTLRLLGIPSKNMRLVYVRVRSTTGTTQNSQAHMVLSFDPADGTEPLILDSLVPEILAASKRPDLHPVFSFNSESLWVKGRSLRVPDPAARLSHWRDVVIRMTEEGVSW